jgi:archaetidylinositol phosphate synthase
MDSCTSYRDAVRLQTSLLAAAEKRLLVAVAARLPRAVSSDHLTLLGAAGMLAAGGSYWLSSRHPAWLLGAIAGLAVNWFGDSLDGTVARVRNCQRPRYGFYVDHVLDTIGTGFLLGGLGLSGYMSPTVALSLLAAYYMLTIEIYLATVVRREFRMAFFKLGPTELRLLLAAGTAVLFVRPRVVLGGSSLLLFDVGGVVAAAGVVGLFASSALRTTQELHRAEPLPSANARQSRGTTESA